MRFSNGIDAFIHNGKTSRDGIEVLCERGRYVTNWSSGQVRKVPSWPRSWATFSFFVAMTAIFLLEYRGPICVFCANLTPFLRQLFRSESSRAPEVEDTAFFAEYGEDRPGRWGHLDARYIFCMESHC